jgi:hypothetical protein
LESDKDWIFDSHDSLLNGPDQRSQQDWLWKINIPSSLRATVLRSLDEHNLNAFSLFDSEDSLLEMLWVREVYLKDDSD